jgi:hypothetical protein
MPEIPALNGSKNRVSLSTNKNHTVALVVIAVLLVVIFTQITVFVIPPIGALPGGKTVVMLRLNKTDFIDSPDAMCERMQGGVNLLCRGMVMAGVVRNATNINAPAAHALKTGCCANTRRSIRASTTLR